MKDNATTVFIVALCVAICLALEADETIILRNGNRLTGRIISETDKDVTIEIPSGTLTVLKRNILKIEKESLPDYPLPRPEPKDIQPALPEVVRDEDLIKIERIGVRERIPLEKLNDYTIEQKNWRATFSIPKDWVFEKLTNSLSFYPDESNPKPQIIVSSIPNPDIPFDEQIKLTEQICAENLTAFQKVHSSTRAMPVINHSKHIILGVFYVSGNKNVLRLTLIRTENLTFVITGFAPLTKYRNTLPIFFEVESTFNLSPIATEEQNKDNQSNPKEEKK